MGRTTLYQSAAERVCRTNMAAHPTVAGQRTGTVYASFTDTNSGSDMRVERTLPLGQQAAGIALGGLFKGFAWGHVRLAQSWWLTGLYIGAAVTLLGCVRKFAGFQRLDKRTVVLGVLGLSMVFVWANTIFRPLPMIEGGF